MPGAVGRVCGVAGLTMVAACFAPTVPEGLPCGPPPEQACPAGQACDPIGVCRGMLADAPGVADAPGADAPPGTPDAPPADAAFVWTIARIDELSGSAADQDPSMTADGLQIVFVSTRPGAAGGNDLWSSSRAAVSDPWGTPVPLALLNTPSDEASPELDRQGLSLHFISARTGNQDVYAVFRAAPTDPWGTPAVVPGLSTGESEVNIASHANLIAVVDRYTGTSRELFLSERAVTSDPWPAGTPIPAVNTPTFNEGSPFLSDDHLTLFFHRQDFTQQMYQIYVSTRTSTTAAFGAPQPMFAPDDGDPWASPDGKTMLFNRGDDLYIATRP